MGLGTVGSASITSIAEALCILAWGAESSSSSLLRLSPADTIQGAWGSSVPLAVVLA